MGRSGGLAITHVERRIETEIYLDTNATTRVIPRAADAARTAMEILYGNPSSAHITGLRARRILEETRRRAARVLGAGDGRIIFTSGATEAIQMAILSALREVIEARRSSGATSEGRVLLYGATEHKAVPEALRHWNRLLDVADEVLAVPVDGTGRLDLQFLAEHAARADMIATMAVNNETGVVHDLDAIESVIRRENPGVRWLVDCVQAVGKKPLDLAGTSVDFAAVSGHKIYAPKGVGLLYVRERTPVTPLIAGGGQEAGARSGTENLPGVAALGAVLGCLLDPDDDTFQPPTALVEHRDRLVASLRSAFPGIAFNTPFEHAVPTTINFAVEALTSKELLDLFDAAGIRVSSGSACGSAIQGSYVLEAMGIPNWRCQGAIRMSFGLATSPSDIEEGCRIIEETGRALRGSCILVADDIDPASPRLQSGLLQLKRGSNCTWMYVSAETRDVVVVDPIAEVADRIERLVRCQDCRVLAVLDTHEHNDRPSCRSMLVELLGVRAHDARTSDPLGWPERASGPLTLGDGTDADHLELGGGEVLARTPLPGHTVEGRAYLLGRPGAGDALSSGDIRFVFSGDTVLIGGLGRTDFRASAVASLFESLHRLERIVAPQTIICPTHDYTNDFLTTLAAEREGGSLLGRVLDPIAPMTREAFEREMRETDTRIESTASELICGLISVDDHLDSSVNVAPEELPAFFRQHARSHVVDVREMHESRFTTDWSMLGLSKPPINVPLTRFTDYVSGLLRDRAGGADYEVVFFCRSGSRSGRAAAVLRRLGFAGSWHLAGGLAVCAPELVSTDRMTAAP